MKIKKFAEHYNNKINSPVINQFMICSLFRVFSNTVQLCIDLPVPWKTVSFR